MSLHEPDLKHGTDYAQRFLVRFQREVLDRGRRAHSFSRLCDMAAIPRDLRAALLQRLVLHGSLQPEGGDLVSLTAAGLQLATAPLPSAEATTNPTPHDTESRVRTPGSGSHS